MSLKRLKLIKRREDESARLAEVLASIDEAQTLLSEFGEKVQSLGAKLDEMTEESSDEERAKFEEERTSLEKEMTETTEEVAALEKEKNKLEERIKELEKEIAEAGAYDPVGDAEKKRSEKARKDVNGMNYNKRFAELTLQERTEVLERDGVKAFVEEMKDLQMRKITGTVSTEVFVPEEIAGFINLNTEQYSKLLKYVRRYSLKGKGRLNIVGKFPVATWTEKNGAVQTVEFDFGQVEFDGYKVGAVVFVPKATLEDSDDALLEALIEGLGQSIAKAIDQAILFGDGKKMPCGIYTRLESTSSALTSQFGEGAEDLSTTHIVKINETDAKAKFGALVKGFGLLECDKTDGLFWAMNRKTFAKLQSDLLQFNATGALVAQLDKTMPVIGGVIEILDFIGDDDIIGGYGAGYVVVDRKDLAFDSNDRVQWVEEMTGYKATQRMDGKPVQPKAFVAFEYANGTIDKAAPKAK